MRTFLPGHMTRCLALTATAIAVVGGLDVRSAIEPKPGASGVSANGQEPGTRVSGSERLAWDQPTTAAELSRLVFIAYVDDRQVSLGKVSCAPAREPAHFECVTLLPPMTPGAHTIEVAAAVMQDGRALQGPRSGELRVDYQPGTGTPRPPSGEYWTATVDGVQLHATVVARGLDDPTDVATLPDGRVLVSERAGRVRVYRDRALLATPAVVLADVATTARGGLLALAADPEFDARGFVYVLYTTAGGLRVARLSAAGDALTAHAVLLEGLPIASAQPRAVLHVGSDRRLYIGLDDGGDRGRVADLGSPSGKVLRLNLDGTTPADNRTGSPRFARGAHRPAGLAAIDSRTLGFVGADADGREWLWILASGDSTRESVATRRLELPVGTGAAGLAVLNGGRDSFPGGTLLIAADHAQGLLRVRLGAAGTLDGLEWLFRGEFGPIRAIQAAGDGTLFAATDQALVRIDVVGRLTPMR